MISMVTKAVVIGLIFVAMSLVNSHSDLLRYQCFTICVMGAVGGRRMVGLLLIFDLRMEDQSLVIW